jgi:nucleoside-diphosphate-sugar epimerase
VLSARARLALMHVHDAAAHTAALALRGGGGVYTLADGRPEGYGWREIMGAAAAAVGRRPALASFPPALLPALAGASGFLARMNGRPPLVSDDKVRELLHPDWAVSRAEMAEGLPPPRFTLEAGFASAVAWYRAAGWLR